MNRRYFVQKCPTRPKKKDKGKDNGKSKGKSCVCKPDVEDVKPTKLPEGVFLGWGWDRVKMGAVVGVRDRVGAIVGVTGRVGAQVGAGTRVAVRV